MRRRIAALSAAVALAAGGGLAGCGGAGPDEDPRRILTERVGRGPQTAFVIRPDVDGPLPVVLFLHGWGATLPRNYRPWLDHLARRGNAVIYPRYQDSVLTPPSQGPAEACARGHRRPGAI